MAGTARAVGVALLVLSLAACVGRDPDEVGTDARPDGASTSHDDGRDPCTDPPGLHGSPHFALLVTNRTLTWIAPSNVRVPAAWETWLTDAEAQLVEERARFMAEAPARFPSYSDEVEPLQLVVASRGQGEDVLRLLADTPMATDLADAAATADQLHVAYRLDDTVAMARAAFATGDDGTVRFLGECAEETVGERSLEPFMEHVRTGAADAVPADATEADVVAAVMAEPEGPYAQDYRAWVEGRFG